MSVQQHVVIMGIPVEEDLGKCKQSVYGCEVSNIKRLLKTVDDERVKSLSVLLEVQGPELQERVTICCMSFPVRPYITPFAVSSV